MNVVEPPVAVRVMNSTSPVGRTSRMTWAEPGSSESRIITPAFANVFVGVVLVTRATISACVSGYSSKRVPESLNAWLTNWNASLVPQMSAPAPRTVNTPAAYDALPARPVAPTSWLAQYAGSVEPP